MTNGGNTSTEPNKGPDYTFSGIIMATAGKLTYFMALRSRGEPTQMIAAYGGVNIEVELISFEEWGNRKGKVAPFMPYITNPDGTIMIETCVICKHLATLGGKFVVDTAQDDVRTMSPRRPGHTYRT